MTTPPFGDDPVSPPPSPTSGTWDVSPTEPPTDNPPSSTTPLADAPLNSSSLPTASNLPATGGGQAAVGPGWMYAAGDPAGTVRWWDGLQWIGGPRPAGDNVAMNGTGATGVSEAVRTTAIVVSVIKAIGGALTFLLLLLAAIMTEAIEDSFTDASGESIDIASFSVFFWAIALIYAAIAGLLLWGQLSGALQRNRGRLFVWSTVMVVLDTLALLLTLTDPTVITVPLFAVTAAQAWVSYATRPGAT